MKSFEEVIIICIEQKLTLMEYFALYSMYTETSLFQAYKDIHGYEGKLLSTIMVETLLQRQFIVYKEGKMAINKELVKDLIE
jgi:hypothetical protein